jgi:guanyl-specific ribonuclease Sa
MSYLTSRAVKALLALALAVVGTLGLATVSVAAPVAHPAAAQVACGNTSSYQKVNLSSLPAQAATTVKLIKQGGPFPYPKNDGVVFRNDEHILPLCSSGYYHEYTVPTPGSSNRGTRRMITGSAGEYFYTGDHYATFSLVNIGK